MTPAFESSARVVSGTGASLRPLTAMRVLVVDGHLRVLPADREGVVLDIGLERVETRGDDDADSVTVGIDGVPLRIFFGALPGDGAGRRRRLLPRRRAAEVRRAFLAACEGSR
jgi:hypothetical protein